MRQRIINLIRTWKLPVSMLCGIILYYILEASVSSGTEGALYGVISHIIQPLLIFAMLTLSFLKVRLHDLKPHRWHVVVLMLQALTQRILRAGIAFIRLVNRLEYYPFSVILEIGSHQHRMIALFLRLNVIPVRKAIKPLIIKIICEVQIQICRIKFLVNLLI